MDREVNRINSAGKSTSAKVDQRFFRVELDSNADTCCVGEGVMIVNATDRYVTATPFVNSLGTIKKVPIVTAAVAYDDPRSGKVVVLVIHQALYFPEMQRCLMCPMQLRLNDVVINQRSKFLTSHPTEKDHAIVVEDLLICLSINKVASYFDARTPTKKLSCTFRTNFRFRLSKTETFGHLDRKGSSDPEEFCLTVTPKVPNSSGFGPK